MGCEPKVIRSAQKFNTVFFPIEAYAPLFFNLLVDCASNGIVFFLYFSTPVRINFYIIEI